MQLLKVFHAAQGLASLARYSQTKLVVPESVLEHTGWVCLFAYLLGVELNSVARTTHAIPMDDLLASAVVHDIEELVTGDIARTVKYHSHETQEIFKRLKADGIVRVIAELHLSSKSTAIVLATSTNAKAGKVGALVDLADKAAVVYKLWDEIICRGNLTMVKQANNVAKFLPSLKAKLDNEMWFNAEQRLYLLVLFNELTMIVKEAACRDNHLLGTIHEDYHPANGASGNTATGMEVEPGPDSTDAA
jgi:5'-deoxynucleotidase YfbR-like HD superfamily hydrolase